MKPGTHLWRPAREALVTAMALLLLPVPAPCESPEPIDEYAIKGAMLLNIARFVEWPPSKPGESFVIGVLGPAAVAADIERIVQGKSVGSRAVTFRRMNSLVAAAECHLVFLARTERKLAEKDTAGLAKAAVLTVGETDHFAADGGVIGLVVRDKRLHMEVNLKAAQDAGLSISSRILRLATVVEGGA